MLSEPIRSELRRASARWLGLATGILVFALAYAVSSSAGATSGQSVAISVAVVCLLAVFVQGIALGAGLGPETAAPRWLESMFPLGVDFGGMARRRTGAALSLEVEARRARRLLKRTQYAAERARAAWEDVDADTAAAALSAQRVSKLVEAHTALAARFIRLAQAESVRVDLAFHADFARVEFALDSEMTRSRLACDGELGSFKQADRAAFDALRQVLDYVDALREVADVELSALAQTSSSSVPPDTRSILVDVARQSAQVKQKLSASRARVTELRAT